ncbi:MAG: hypothetical protein ABL891_00575 [Burkholderiales bacterium]
MYRLAASVFLFFTAAASSWAHEGHGATSVHLHWWEYALLAAAIAAIAGYLARK